VNKGSSPPRGHVTPKVQLSPLGSNFTLGVQLHPWGPTSPLGSNFTPSGQHNPWGWNLAPRGKMKSGLWKWFFWSIYYILGKCLFQVSSSIQTSGAVWASQHDWRGQLRQSLQVQSKGHGVRFIKIHKLQIEIKFTSHKLKKNLQVYNLK
jgi:hypothetical protein